MSTQKNNYLDPKGECAIVITPAQQNSGLVKRIEAFGNKYQRRIIWYKWNDTKSN